MNRLLYGFFRPKKTILGSDIAGRIEAVGKNVERFQLGDEVFGYARALSCNGTYVTVGGSVARLFQFLFLWPLISMTSKKAMRVVVLKPNKDLAYMNELFEAGKVKPVIDKLRKLSEVPEAMRYFGAGNHKGKVVITLE